MPRKYIFRLIKHQIIGSGGISPRILKLGTRWTWVVFIWNMHMWTQNIIHIYVHII